MYVSLCKGNGLVKCFFINVDVSCDMSIDLLLYVLKRCFAEIIKNEEIKRNGNSIFFFPFFLS